MSDDKPAPKPIERVQEVVRPRSGRPDTPETFRTGLSDALRKPKPAGGEKP